MTKREKKELTIFKDALRLLKRDYGTKMCGDYAPGCANCQAQMLIGLLQDHIDTLTWNPKTPP